jgi:hypothetical protein
MWWDKTNLDERKGKRKKEDKNALLFITPHTSPHWICHDSNLQMTCWLAFLVAEEVARAARNEWATPTSWLMQVVIFYTY